MKIWITEYCEDKSFVRLYPFNPLLSKGGYIRGYTHGCRIYMARLLRGSGARLPKHGSDEVICIELTARKVKS